MEQLKVKKKATVVINVIFYLGLAFLFLYLQYAYRHHLSPFSLTYFKKSAELFWYVAAPIVAAAWLIWRHHRFAVWAYNFSVILVGYKVVEGLFIEFNKIIVVALFFYSVISYFLYQLLTEYLALASINANYGRTDLFDPLLQKIECQIETASGSYSGFLTNWDENGCFIKLNKPQKLSKKLKVTINFQKRVFHHKGEVVAEALDLSGVGIRFKKMPKDLTVFNWAEFTELVHELGFKPERLR